MGLELRDDDRLIDLKIHCNDCEAVCCRMQVIIEPKDKVPQGMSGPNADGLKIMMQGGDGWCIALDRKTKRCGIYELRPDSCRRFTMGAGYCRSVREKYYKHTARIIPHLLDDGGIVK
jgi:uncharacterized protein